MADAIVIYSIHCFDELSNKVSVAIAANNSNNTFVNVTYISNHLGSRLHDAMRLRRMFVHIAKASYDPFS